MPRRIKHAKPLIFVFCEGESEQAYTDFLKQRFANVAVIKRPSATGLFEEADRRFQKDPKFRDYAEVTDEIWFFFDVETKDIGKWEQRLAMIKRLRRLRRNPNIRVRLLMTTGCIEYWLMLHYKMFSPPVLEVADKERILAEVVAREASYVEHAEKILCNLLSDGLPGLEDTDERNQWLCKQCKTFSTVNEAITFLEQLHR